MKNIERIVVILIFTVLTAVLSFIKSNQWIEGHFDTAISSQLVESIAAGKGPYTQLETGWRLIVDRRIAMLPAQKLCQEDTLSVANQTPSNFFTRWHSYFIVYLLAPLLHIINVNVLFAVITVISYLAVIFLAYIFLRNNNISIFSSILFCTLVTFHPSWSEGFFGGQMIYDRIFLLFGTLFIYLFTSKKIHKWWIIIVGCLSALIVERIGIYIGVFAIMYTLLFWKERISSRRFGIITGAFFLAYSLLNILFVNKNLDYGSFMPLNFSALINNINFPGFTQKLGIFLIMNLGLLTLAIFTPKRLIIALGVLLPNIMGNIGGAEKTGWSIHYHVLYLPFLVWSAACGFVWLYQKASQEVLISRLVETPRSKYWISNLITTRLNPLLSRVKINKVMVLNILIIVLILLFGGLDPYSPSTSINHLTYISQNAVIKLLKLIPNYWPEENLHKTHNIYEQLQKVIPEGSVVSSPEFAMPSLINNRTIWFFPLSIDVADYVINPSGDFSYLNEDERELIDDCLKSRMVKAGFDLENPIRIGYVLVYQRNSPK